MSESKRAGAGHSDISGSNGRRIQVRAARGAMKDEPKRVGFDEDRKELFLAYFSATCNAKAAARAAGVANSTVYEHRRKDAAFRAAWNEALEQGYARLEAELVRRASAVPRVRAKETAAADNRTIDPRTALAILESYRRNGERRPGEILAQPYDIDAVRDRLERKMRALGMIEEPADAASGKDRPTPNPAAGSNRLGDGPLPGAPEGEGK